MTETTSQINPGKSAPVTPVLSNRTKRMYRRRGLSNLLKMGHCAPTVMETLLDLGNTKEEWMVKMTAGLPGGTAFKGLTCSAFTAGLMAIGLKLGEIEDSNLRVIRMLTTMITGGNALADNMNKFNRLLNIGHRMSKWFTKEFGSTICHEVKKCDFSSLGDVHRYIDKDSVTTCKNLAEKVANQAQRIIDQNGIGF